MDAILKIQTGINLGTPSRTPFNSPDTIQFELEQCPYRQPWAIMNSKRATILSGLLKEMIQDGTNFYPDEIWLDIHHLFALPYVELVIPRSSHGGWEIFLVRRPATDPYWPSMWHLPGGLWRTYQTQIQACRSVARRELGIGVTRVEEVMTYKWTTHPYGNPISHICLCRP